MTTPRTIAAEREIEMSNTFELTGREVAMVCSLLGAEKELSDAYPDVGPHPTAQELAQRVVDRLPFDLDPAIVLQCDMEDRNPQRPHRAPPRTRSIESTVTSYFTFLRVCRKKLEHRCPCLTAEEQVKLYNLAAELLEEDLILPKGEDS